jgi:predicted GNAT superfamily acetyltransferase
VTAPLPDFRIRELVAHHEVAPCVDVQKRVWGEGFDELVPAAILWIAARTGGIVAGAFDERDRMLGFVFGISGWVERRPVHWSDMLAVLPEARGSGVGRQLKLYQYRTLVSRGIFDVGWTFDPLESRNAFLNFVRLGITAAEYVRHCYGASNSPLHEGLETDRLIARWQLDSPRVRSRMEAAAGTGGKGAAAPAPGAADAPLVNDGPERPRLDLNAPVVRIRIPADIQGLKARDRELAAAWRCTTRTVFETYFARGYTAVDLIRESSHLSSYVLTDRARSHALRT